jgi:hypothetical protein
MLEIGELALDTWKRLMIQPLKTHLLNLLLEEIKQLVSFMFLPSFNHHSIVARLMTGVRIRHYICLHTYIYIQVALKNINDNLVFQRVEHKVYEILPFAITSTRVPIYPDYGTIIQMYG